MRVKDDTRFYGFIDEVEDDIVYGRFVHSGDKEFPSPIFFEMHILNVLEDQRVDLQPGAFCSTVNGHLLIDKTICTTYDMEKADEEAGRMYLMMKKEWEFQSSAIGDL